jgi:hypothetical protein
MKLINRGVVVIKPRQPFVDWLNQVEEDFTPPTLEKLRGEECTSILVPALYGIQDVLEFLEPLKPTLFELELAGWFTDPKLWPAERTSDVFDAWFDLEVHSMVWDAGNAPIMAEQTLPTPLDYPAPVNQLLTYGDCRDFSEWPNYPEALDLGPEHIPHLIRMATDDALLGDFSETLAVWAPVHAWRALGQLSAKDAAEPLTYLFHRLERDEWMLDEIPIVYQMIGPAAIPALADYLADDSHGPLARGVAAESLERIGTAYPNVRAACVAVLTNQLEQFAQNDPELNSFLVAGLLDLRAVESLPAIERTFAAGGIDETFINWDDVQHGLGIAAPHPRQAQQMRLRRRRRRRK